MASPTASTSREIQPFFVRFIFVESLQAPTTPRSGSPTRTQTIGRSEPNIEWRFVEVCYSIVKSHEPIGRKELGSCIGLPRSDRMDGPARFPGGRGEREP